MNTNREEAHVLDIHHYSFQDLLNLFGLSYKITIEDLKKARHKVLMMHPDKSRLSPDYFLFYTKAFRLIHEYYETNQKTTAEVPQFNPEYEKIIASGKDDLSKSTKKNIRGAIKQLKPEEFNQKFNRLFDDLSMARRPDPEKNKWFSSEEPAIDIDPISSKDGIHGAMEKIKQRATSSTVSQYTGVKELASSHIATDLYDKDDESGEYIASDPFGKLRFDDLRKVHKDQTVLAVSERDLAKVRLYESSEHLARSRASESIVPLDQKNAEQYLLTQEEAHRQRILAKQHSANLETMDYAEKNKSVISAFLLLKH